MSDGSACLACTLLCLFIANVRHVQIPFCLALVGQCYCQILLAFLVTLF